MWNVILGNWVKRRNKLCFEHIKYQNNAVTHLGWNQISTIKI